MKTQSYKSVYTILVCFLIIFTSASESDAQLRIGMGGSIYFKPFYVGPQVRVAFDASDNVRLSGSGTYYIGSASFFALDFDARYKLATVGTVSIEPLAGLNVNDGINLNAGIHFRIERDKNDIFIEPKFIIDKSASFILSGGIFF